VPQLRAVFGLLWQAAAQSRRPREPLQPAPPHSGSKGRSLAADPAVFALLRQQHWPQQHHECLGHAVHPKVGACVRARGVSWAGRVRAAHSLVQVTETDRPGAD
jgi:hypothetical protein